MLREHRNPGGLDVVQNCMSVKRSVRLAKGRPRMWKVFDGKI